LPSGACLCWALSRHSWVTGAHSRKFGRLRRAAGAPNDGSKRYHYVAGVFPTRALVDEVRRQLAEEGLAADVEVSPFGAGWQLGALGRKGEGRVADVVVSSNPHALAACAEVLVVELDASSGQCVYVLLDDVRQDPAFKPLADLGEAQFRRLWAASLALAGCTQFLPPPAEDTTLQEVARTVAHTVRQTGDWQDAIPRVAGSDWQHVGARAALHVRAPHP